MSDQIKVKVGSSGISLGGALAVCLSWWANKSVGWAILHGIFGWFYVIYFCFQNGCNPQ